MSKYIDAERLIAGIEQLKETNKPSIKRISEYIQGGIYGFDIAVEKILAIIATLQQEQPDEQPEYGYLSTEYVHGKKPRWSVGDVLAYYICTSNEEGEDILGKIVNVEFDEEDGWVYTFEDESVRDEQSLVEEETYKKN